MTSPYKLALFLCISSLLASAGVTVSSPADGATVGSPVRIVAAASSSSPIIAMKVYVDHNVAYSTSSSKVDTSLSLPAGWRYIVVQSWDSQGNIQKAPLRVNVTTSTAQKIISNIDQLTGWEHCDVCAGIGGAGADIPYSMTQGRSSPSMDGRSTEFWIGGTTPYSNALWWKQLGGNNNAYNFTYDLYFYIKDPSASQALEFDVNQSTKTRKYIFGTECNLRETKTWRVWDTANSNWIGTSIPCTNLAAYQWHHLVWEFKREGEYTTFVSVSLDGKKSYVNRKYRSRASGAYEVNVAFQMDGNSSQTDHSVWLDKITLKYW